MTKPHESIAFLKKIYYVKSMGSCSIRDVVVAVILAGGRGTRLYPLTKARCKPSVSFGGRYKLIDIPISNSINSGIDKIFVIAQYFSSSLQKHVERVFPSLPIRFLTPQQEYIGTADAIRKNLEAIMSTGADYFLILSGDQIYNMDLGKFVEFGMETKADLTIAATIISTAEAMQMGVLRISCRNEIVDFFEKPTTIDTLQKYILEDGNFWGSMGIYLFKKEALAKLVREDIREDFGKHLIPSQVKKGNTFAYCYNGYWQDIGTIYSFYNSNLQLAQNKIDLGLYSEHSPIYTSPQHIPSARIVNTMLHHSLVCEGSIIYAEKISCSMIGLRTFIDRESVISNTVILGNKYSKSLDCHRIGKKCFITNAIIDDSVSIGNGVRLTNKNNLRHLDSDGIYIRDGIIIVSSGTDLPDRFEL